SQSSQETNVNNGKNIASNKSTKQKSPEKPSSSKGYTALQTQDEFRLKSRDLLAAALSMSELPEGSADP
ncbi:unnamed protein product, partial [Rotaria magnacalcarata]